MRFSVPKNMALLLTTLCVVWLVAPETTFAQGMCQVPEGCESECQATCAGESCAGEAPCDIEYRSMCGPIWSVTAEAVVLQRTPTRAQNLFTSPNSFDASQMNARDLNLSVGAGYQINVIRHDILGHDWEFVFFQDDGFSTQNDFNSLTHMLTDVNGTGYLVNNAWARYNSALYSGELNMRKNCTEWFTLLAGFRMVQLNEHYTAAGIDAASATTTDSLNISAVNHLYGCQLGSDMIVYDMGGPLQINALCRAGVYGNSAHENYRRMVVADGVVTTEDNSGAGFNQASFLGEAGLTMTYALTKHLAFHGSAKTMWLTGVAFAPEQVDAVNLRTGQYGVNTSGAAFYYGGGMGLEYRY